MNGKTQMQKSLIGEGKGDLEGTTSSTKERRMTRVGDEKTNILQDQKQEGLEQDEHCQSWVGI